MPEVRIATGPLAWLMRWAGFLGWTSLWATIYVLPGHERNQRLLRHELKHLEQIKRDGRLVFSIKYLWWLARHVNVFLMPDEDGSVLEAYTVYPSTPTRVWA